jgi:peptidoglycan/xylan/chitin deacetylase (PgdA/CDA1 family)
MHSRLKTFLYRGGVTSTYHRWRNRRCLTVVMFHRVLPVGDPEWADAEPVWTVSDSVFRDCLDFFQKHYNVVGLQELLDARQDSGKLPDRSLLITFDDGWADTEWCALPILKEAGLTAVVFVVAEGVGQQELWQERVLKTWRLRRLEEGQLSSLMPDRTAKNGTSASLSCESTDTEWALIRRLTDMEPAERAETLEKFFSAIGRPQRAQMLTQGQLRELHSSGMAIGSHGLTHAPVPELSNVTRDLSEARTLLARSLSIPKPKLQTLSFPYGIYDRAAVNAAYEAGYQLVFTSDKGLNTLPKGRRLPSVLGRLNIDGPAISGGSGRLRPELMASWLFARPHIYLESKQ